MPRLEQWAFVSLPRSGYKAPEQMTFTFTGIVYGHPRFGDGDPVTTSGFVEYDPDEGVFITHSGSRYTLGQPHPDYEARFPNARERVVAQAQKKEEDRGWTT
jgi:hypothetical protein